MVKLTNFKRSLWVFHASGGSCNGCDIEIIAALTPRYDAERFGIKLVGSPRHADVLLVTGAITRDFADKLKRIYEQMPDPKLVIVVGNYGIYYSLGSRRTSWHVNIHRYYFIHRTGYIV